MIAINNTKALDLAKATKLQVILNDFNTAEATPVPFNGNDYNGGEESATSIDKYVRLNRLAGNTTHTIWDINNVNTFLTDTQADDLILSIGGASSMNKFALKDRKKALSDISLTALATDGVTLLYPTIDDALAAVQAV